MLPINAVISTFFARMHHASKLSTEVAPELTLEVHKNTNMVWFDHRTLFRNICNLGMTVIKYKANVVVHSWITRETKYLTGILKGSWSRYSFIRKELIIYFSTRWVFSIVAAWFDLKTNGLSNINFELFRIM